MRTEAEIVTDPLPPSRRKRRLSPVALLISAAVLLAIPSAAAAAPSLEVGGPGATDTGACVLHPCATIGYAIAQAGEGDTIDVAAGHYEEQLTIEKPLTLQGDIAGGTQIGPLSLASVLPGSAITLGPGSDGTAIRDLELRSAAQLQPTIATVGGEIDDVTIEGVDQKGIGPSTLPTTIAAGLELSVPTAGWEVLDSSFEGDYHGILVSGDSSDLTVEGSSFDHDRNGFYVARSTPLGPTSKGTVEGLRLAECEFLEDEYRGLYFEGLGDATIEDISVVRTGAGFTAPPFGAAGLSLNLKAGDYGHVKIAGVRIVGSLHEGITIQVRGYPGDTPYEGAGAATLQSVEVSDSTITGNGGPGVAITNEPNLGSATITGSRITGNGLSDLITGGAASSNGIFALDKLPGAPSVDAADNWFGCNSGPSSASCDSVDPQAIAEPWLVLTGGAAAPTLAPGATTAIRAAIDTDSAGLAAGPAPEGTPVTFVAGNGTVAPVSTALAGGQANAIYTAGAVGAGEVTVTVDGQSVAVPLSVQAPPTETKPTDAGPQRQEPAPSRISPATIEPTEAKAPKTVAPSGMVTVATVECASSKCEVEATRPAIKIGGRSFAVKVKVPATLAGGASAPVRVVLPKKAREALAENGKGTVKVRVTVTAADGTTKTVTITLTVKAKHHQRP